MNYDKLKVLFPRASKAFYEANPRLQDPEPKRPVRDGTLGKEKRKDQGTTKRHIRITSLRSRLLDPDNLCPKYVIDALRHAKVIEDDSPEHIILTVAQKKVDTKKQEYTEVVIW